MRLTGIAAAAVGVLAAGSARADQCAWINKEQAVKAAELIRAGDVVVRWCEPCGEKPPKGKSAYRVENVRVAPARDAVYSEVSINGKAVDLAYVFLMTAPGEFKNLALLAGCPATDVTKGFRMDVPPELGTSAPPPRMEKERKGSFQELENEAGRDLRTLYTALTSAQPARGPVDLRKLGWLPEACPNGSRPGTPSDDWVPGCNFIYRATADDEGLTGEARCVTGSMAGETYEIRTTGPRRGLPAKARR